MRQEQQSLPEEQFQITCSSEDQLQSSLINILVRQSIGNNFPISTSPDALASNVIQRIEGFQFFMLFVREKNHESPFNNTSKSEPILTKAMDFLYQSISEKYFCVHCFIDNIKFLVLEADSTIFGHTAHEQFLYVENLLNSLQEQISQQLGTTIQILCSDIVKIANNVAAVFRSALFSVDYVFDIYPDKNVVTIYTTMQQVPDTSALIPHPEWERNYLDALSNYQFRKMEQMVHRLIENEIRSPSLALSVRNRLQNRMYWTLTVLGLPVNNSLEQCTNIYKLTKDILSCKTCQDLHFQITQFYTLLAQYYQSIPINIDVKLEMIMNYIQNHYLDVNISATEISNKFSISTGHLSRAFKQKTGFKLIDYIHITRLSHAKILLTNSSDNLASIAAACGYTGEWALIRSFKRYEGITPGAFRSINRNKK